MSAVARVAVGISTWAALWLIALAVVMLPLLTVYPWDGGHGQMPDAIGVLVIAYGNGTAIGLALWLGRKMGAL